MPIPTELFATIVAPIATASGQEPATEAIRVWQTLFRKFGPLLGPLSTELLFARSLAIHTPQYPWLPRIAPAAARTAFAEFERILAARAPEDIVAVNHALLASYTKGLLDLIGAGLTTRLLAAAFPDDKTNTQP